jgi:isopentenyl-diphosphate delta-isomerase
MSPPNLPSEIENRKSEHLRVCIEEDVEFQQLTSGLEKYRFTHCCLPELDSSDIELGTTFLGKSLKAPILISSMTGGTELAHLVNTRLAMVAQRYGLAMGVGSQRIALEQPELAPTFAVRSLAPDILLLANLGAVQLNYGCGLEDCLKLVELLEADALILHLNPLQEWVQSGLDRFW